MEYYDLIAKGYDELHKEEQLNKLDIIKNHININKNTRILDVGCGTGVSSYFDCFVVGIDLSIGLLKQNRNSKKLLGAAETLPFKDDSFDCVVSVTSIHNFEDIQKSIKEMKRVGKNKFVFSVLKRADKFNFIEELITKNFKIGNVIEENKDAIFFCQKP
ncbi:hypothetical protein CMO83_00225 [Candidatus Woesearchaeota archaeon]|jgi:ubiquinone/menaquinone biosynthesis C-methylase UbiE|nr:hypothetical protein [Candidatus Woesearchaeota archaeon]MDP6648494.1 methyltransferase domain-containing protein [Candidatus Woesearchaeota archaeon]|tara:strand:+ start:3717 stop:4196 length:480 start_codon:yes stop_codon:yes gene_type:complete